MPPYLSDFVPSFIPCRFPGMRWHFPISIPLCLSLVQALPVFVALSLLPFHASFLTTLCLKVNLKTSVITDNQKAEIIATLSTRLARKWERIAAGILFPGAE